MEEADLRHSRVNVRRKKASAAPEDEGPGPQPRQGRDCVARRILSPSAQGTMGAMPRALTARQDPPSSGWVGGATPQPGQGGGAVEAGPGQAAGGEGPRGQAAAEEAKLHAAGGEGPRGHAAAAEEARLLRQAEEDNGVPATLGPTQRRLGGGSPPLADARGWRGVVSATSSSAASQRAPDGGHEEEGSPSRGGCAATQGQGGQCGLWGLIFHGKREE